MSGAATSTVVGVMAVLGGSSLGVFIATTDTLKMKLCVVVILAVITGGTVMVVAT